MKIDKDHMYHGAALIQIIEHKSYRSVKTYGSRRGKSNCTFLVNGETGILIKYASSPRGRADEYSFTFTQAHLRQLKAMGRDFRHAFAVLVCIDAAEICVLSHEQINDFVVLRKEDNRNQVEPQYQIKVTAQRNRKFRAYIDAPNQKGLLLKETKVSRNDFPKVLFRR
ncbi:MAG: hypothetical protein IT364_07820 [Candidatus Hydrogenedentes bacterium]|nr:hypothetical protein [Candidatus Hydrogenedentota bacterium]